MGDLRGVNASALMSMALVLRLKEKRVSVDELHQQFGHVPEMTSVELQRCLQDIEIKSKWFDLVEKDLEEAPLPGIVCLASGHYGVVIQANKDSVLLQKHNAERAEKIPLSEFVAMTTGKLLLVMEDEQAKEENQREFGLSWFFNTIFKYSSVMRETLFASFFIQIFGLVTPLFFMIVIDKVFSHNNLATLDVLVFAMIVVAVFDVVLNAVRTYLMSHTTNRVDLELGSRLFRHMMKLPLSYYDSRRTGETKLPCARLTTAWNLM